MYNTEIEKKLLTFLEGTCDGTARITHDLVDSFGEDCMKIINNNLLDARLNDKWRLRMSNIGRDIRQLHLEKEHGRAALSIQDKLKFTYGAMIEALVVLLLQASGISIQEANGKCSLTVSETQIDGEFDLIIDNKVWDVKSASPYSYENKFKDLQSVIDGDEFGYIAQLIGYCWATGKKPGGWIVVNKVTGEIKIVEANFTNAQVTDAINAIRHTVVHFEQNMPIPECKGVIDETFRKKPTGNKVLNRSCEYCSCKFKCHPGLQVKPDVSSKAQNPKVKYYVELNNVPKD